jgi:hypothetical protein
MKRIVSTSIIFLLFFSVSFKIFAFEPNDIDYIKNQIKMQDSFIIYIDANGCEVFHNLPYGRNQSIYYPIIIDETKTARIENQKNQKTFINNLNTNENIYDIENNPVHIGTWNGTKVYARHTLGVQSSEGSTKYLTTQGDATWYNSKHLTALPYRNGNANVSPHQNVVDVEKETEFTITATNTGKSITVKVNDFGPNQKSDPGNKTIVDMDSSDFKTIFGKKSIGRSHCTTKVIVKQYFN